MTLRPAALAVLAFVALAASTAARAERADREKPVSIEAARITVDDINKVQIFEGSVVLTQGTLVIKAERIVVTQDADGFQKGVATNGAGGLARLRQKREGKDEYLDGEAERIEYDASTDTAQFFVRAWVRSGGDEVKGNYISYDALNEKYLVTSGLARDGRTPVKAEGGRVRAIIQPNKGAPLPDSSPALPLKPSAEIPGAPPASE